MEAKVVHVLDIIGYALVIKYFMWDLLFGGHQEVVDVIREARKNSNEKSFWDDNPKKAFADGFNKVKRITSHPVSYVFGAMFTKNIGRIFLITFTFLISFSLQKIPRALEPIECFYKAALVMAGLFVVTVLIFTVFDQRLSDLIKLADELNKEEKEG